jgi:hypothetical protein
MPSNSRMPRPNPGRPQIGPLGLWLAAGADVVLGFLVAMFGPDWFGFGGGIAFVIGLAIAGTGVIGALLMSRRLPRD